MSFLVALQSLVFYVVACSPCHQAAHQRQLKQQAKRQREAKERDGSNREGYQQPEPFATNPYWTEEIIMGPHLDRRKHKTASQRPSTSPGGDTAQVGVNGLVTSTTVTTTTTTTVVPPTNPPETEIVSSGNTTNPTIVSPQKENEKPNASVGHGSDVSITSTSPALENGKYRLSPQLATTLPHNWNHKRYQREDEELWGSDLSRTGHKLMDAIKHAGSSAIRSIESSFKDIMINSDDEDDDGGEWMPVVHPPPVNDYHPPIVRRPPFKGTVRWMVQPPPPAKVMEGKVPVSRGSSVTNSIRSNLNRSDTLGDRVIDGISVNRRTFSRGSSVSNLSRRTTASDTQKTGDPATLTEMI
ncbi:hypothetical protein F5Y10DRAFT_208628 [Nemania abortiva]|nr:hypothetical protein F5Y10DRAFT_208628 [Nemania abortiva]